jgi:PKD repeat protein
MKTMSLVRRLPYRRAFGVVAASSLAACNSSDRLTSVDDSPGGLGVAAAQPVQPPSFSSSSLSGIPFGTWALPTEGFGDLYNGAMRNIDPGQLLKELSAIKTRGGKVILAMAGQEDHFKDGSGHFSLSLWKGRIDRFRSVNFNSYIDDGTVIGHYMIDEPNDHVNWGDPVPGTMLDQMAAYSKSIWPKLATVVRADPSYMAKWKITYRYLDAGWSQYVERKGDPATYIKNQVAIAQSLGLGLVTGLNVRKGAIGGKGPMATALMLSAGTALLADDYPCAFINWEYNAPLLNRPDIKAAMGTLSQKAKQHSSQTCMPAGHGGPPPPPPPPPDNQLPVSAFTVASCRAGIGCSFTDQSRDTDGTIASWSWNFGDGSTSTDQSPQHTFAAGQSYTVTLQVTDDKGGKNTSTSSITVGAAPKAPVAAFTPPACTSGLGCQFTDLSTDDGSIASRSWDFGDGATSTEGNPTHSFAASKDYAVTLTVTDNDGGTNSTSATVSVAAPANQVPSAAFAPPSCQAGVPCQFTDGSGDPDGAIASRSWSFPAGATATDANPLNTFSAAGTYSITLTVVDDHGATASVSHDVVVSPSSLPSSGPITVRLAPLTIDGRQKVKLTWSGAGTSKVDVFRNGNIRETTANDGLYIRAVGNATYSFQICEAGTSRCSNTVSTAVAGPPPNPMTLRVKPETTVKPWVVLTWSGGRGANIDFYRDGAYFKTVPNSGSHINSRGIQLGGTYVFKVCEQNSTTCSGNVSVTVK